MAESPNFQTEMRRILRDRMLDAARDVVCAEGWGAVNMSRVAKTVGISRPVLYKEIGTKQDLAQALIARETDVFLTGIVTTVAAYPDDPVGGMTAAAEYALRTGADNTLLVAVLSGRNESDTSLLPALMTDSAPVLGRAVQALTAVARENYGLPGLDDEQLTDTIEIMVRLTLSHLFQPAGSIERAVTQIGGVLRSLLDRAVV